MKYEIGEPLEGSVKKKVTEHYYLFVLTYNKKEGFKRHYLCSQLGAHEIWLRTDPLLYIEDKDGTVLHDSSYLDFKSFENVQKWLNGKSVTVNVGCFQQHQKRIQGFDHYKITDLPGMIEVDKNSLFAERYIWTNVHDAVHIIPTEEELSEGTCRVLKPRNRW